jgi:hypothetical protein
MLSETFRIRSVLARYTPEQGFRSCLGILSLVKSYGPERIEAAARRGNDIRATTYGSIKSILQNGLRVFTQPGPEGDLAAFLHNK